MSTDDVDEQSQIPMSMVLVWLGFDPDKEIYDVYDVEGHNLTLDDLVASLVSHKRDREERRTVWLKVSNAFVQINLEVLVRSLTQMYTPCEAFEDPQRIESYYDDPEWAIEGWIVTRGDFDPSPEAPAIRCFFHADRGGLLEGELQFINPPTL
jgi:hypothetical protein